MSAGRGANCGSISMTARVRPVRRSRPTLITLPTLTPEIRTSAWLPRFSAWLNSALISYPFGLSEVVPPNEIHRNSSSPMHEAANATIVRILAGLGACRFIRTTPVQSPRAGSHWGARPGNTAS